MAGRGDHRSARGSRRPPCRFRAGDRDPRRAADRAAGVSPPFPMGAGTAGLLYGQRAYFLGLPFGWDSGGDDVNRAFPIPFVKAEVVSALSFGPTSALYVDAHGNQGFGGGPVVFLPTMHVARSTGWQELSRCRPLPNAAAQARDRLGRGFGPGCSGGANRLLQREPRDRCGIRHSARDRSHGRHPNRAGAE